MAWDSNPGWQDGRLRRIHWEMAAPQLLNFFTVSAAEQLYLFAQSFMLLAAERKLSADWLEEELERCLGLMHVFVCPSLAFFAFPRRAVERVKHLVSNKSSRVIRDKTCWPILCWCNTLYPPTSSNIIFCWIGQNSFLWGVIHHPFNGTMNLALNLVEPMKCAWYVVCMLCGIHGM